MKLVSRYRTLVFRYISLEKSYIAPAKGQYMFTISPITILIIAAVWLVSALIAGGVAAGRDRDGAVWMTVGLVFGPLAILPPLIFGKP